MGWYLGNNAIYLLLAFPVSWLVIKEALGEPCGFAATVQNRESKGKVLHAMREHLSPAASPRLELDICRPAPGGGRTGPPLPGWQAGRCWAASASAPGC